MIEVIVRSSDPRQKLPQINHAASLAGAWSKASQQGQAFEFMKVNGTSGVTQTSGAKSARPAGGGEGFRVPGPAGAQAPAQVSSASGVGGVLGVEALLAMQDIETPTERRRRSVRRAGRLLDELDEIKIALLGGELGTAQLERLGRAIREQRSGTEDPKLETLLDEIETRAAVELAKLEMSRSSA